MFLISTVLAFAVSASTPQITPEQRAEYWRAYAESIAAQAKAQEAQVKLKDVIDKLKQTCGNGELTADPQGEPVCKEKKQ